MERLTNLLLLAPKCHPQSLRNRELIAAAAGLLLACALHIAAQDRGYWRAASTNANAITGDITISELKVTIDFTTYPLAYIRALSTAEVAAAFDADVNAGGNGALYRLRVPAATRFLHRNTLCGTEDTQWMATYVSGRTLEVAFFSGTDAPVFTVDALVNSYDLCGSFTYAR
jgi:hypothetical protein